MGASSLKRFFCFLILILFSLSFSNCRPRNKAKPGDKSSTTPLTEEVAKQESNKKTFVEVPSVDPKASEDEVKKVTELKKIAFTETNSSADRAGAIIELILFPAYASAVTGAVLLARGVKKSGEIFDATKGTTDRILIAALARYFQETHFASPSIVESEMALYEKVASSQDAQSTRDRLVVSFAAKLSQRLDLAVSSLYLLKLRLMALNEVGETQAIAVRGFAYAHNIVSETFAQTATDVNQLTHAARFALVNLLEFSAQGLKTYVFKNNSSFEIEVEPSSPSDLANVAYSEQAAIAAMGALDRIYEAYDQMSGQGAFITPAQYLYRKILEMRADLYQNRLKYQINTNSVLDQFLSRWNYLG